MLRCPGGVAERSKAAVLKTARLAEGGAGGEKRPEARRPEPRAGARGLASAAARAPRDPARPKPVATVAPC